MDAIERQKAEWAAQAKWEAEMAAKRAARLANHTGSGRVAPRGWGMNGVRHDEACESCGRIGEVDNRTGLCRTCGQ